MADRIPSRSIGAAGLAVTELGFGAATLGNLYAPISDHTAHAALGSALDRGIRYVDTSPFYGFGLSERRVGDVLRGVSDIIVSTKVGRLLLPDELVHDDRERFGFRSPMPFRPVFDYSYDGVMRSYEASLRRLGLSRIDILYVHDIGRLTHGLRDGFHFDALTNGGGLRALEALRRSGAITAFGVGVNEVAACERTMDHADLDVILLAGRYTLLEQGALTSLFPRCLMSGTKVVIGGPYNSGILATGTAGPGPHFYDYHEAPRRIIEKVKAIEEVCGEYGVPLAAAALQFPLAHPSVVSVVPGLSDARLVQQTLELYRTQIPDDFWSALHHRRLIGADAPIPMSETVPSG
jgi:D-threo-aldose 1-dehydrogenase